jgi:DinB superfamily
MSSVTVPSSLEAIALIFKLNNEMVLRSLEGLSDADCWRRPSDGNPMAWLVGHVTVSRAQLLAGLGHAYDHGLGPLFKRGATLGSPGDYPSRTLVEAAWRDTRARMRDAFASLTDDRLAEPSGGKPLPGVKTTADLIAFSAFHESYHVGQMGYVRRLLGEKGIAG